MNIAIAGLGWLGAPLTVQLKNFGHHVKGSVTSKEKQAKLTSRGLDTYVVEITEDGINGEINSLLFEAELLLILIPPGLRRGTGHDHALRMAQLLKVVEVSSVHKVILVSSTGVYDDAQGQVTELDVPLPQDNKGKQLLEVEQLFRNSQAFEGAVVRFGGLFGGSRNPAKYLAGRTGLSKGTAPVNLIHRTDCIGIILAVIYKKAYGHIFNAVVPQHPTKAEYYGRQAVALGLEPPQYEEEANEEVSKQVDSVRVKEVLGYSFQVEL